MTSPAVTIQPEGTLARAARLMNTHHVRRLPVVHVRRLPVVDSDGKLLGIISRRDLLSVFLRPDPEVAQQVREILTELLPGGPAGVEVTVHNGVVTLTGAPETSADADLIQIAVRLTWDVDGVVDVIKEVGPAAPHAAAAR